MKNNTFRFIGHTCTFDYSSQNKLGSIENFKDLKSIGERKYGKLFEIEDYDNYKLYVNGYGKGKILNISNSI